MKFSVIVALFGYASAIRGPCNAPPAPQDCSSDNGAYAAQSGLQAGALRGLRANLAAPSSSSAYGKLCSESAASKTEIGASNVVIPDKSTVTDQAKVTEDVSKGSSQAQTCQVAQRKFTIGGEITVTEKYNDSLKAENVAEKSGEGASQTKSRTHVLCNCQGKAEIPLTAACNYGAAAGQSCCN
jgi:hypothetical protein